MDAPTTGNGHDDVPGSMRPPQVAPVHGEGQTHRGAPRDADVQLAQTLRNAGYLLAYAVEAGIDVDADTAQCIIGAIRRGDAAWDGSDAGALSVAIGKLAAKTRPVTAESLRACRDDAAGVITSYKRIVYYLAAFIVPLSVLAFAYSSISSMITADVKAANDLAVALHTQFDGTPSSGDGDVAPPGSLTELQQFAAGMRAIRARANELWWLAPIRITDDFADEATARRLELSSFLANTRSDLLTELNDKTAKYQQVRAYAIGVQGAASVVWGAIANCILPVLYALLGACAYVLRIFTQQTTTKTFEYSYSTPARFIIAAIAGEVVGLFSNFNLGQVASLPPLGIAFLVGYAADIFFSFLEGSMQGLGRSK